VPGKIVAIQQFLGKLRNQMALRHFGHAEGRDDTGHVFLHDGAGDRSAHILLKGNIGVLQPEHHHGQTLVLAILGEPEAPPDIDRIKDDEGDIVLMKFLRHHGAGIAFASPAFGEDSKGFGGGGNGDV
jgi:hypothetical protein